jgi:hypothetical protein
MMISFIHHLIGVSKGLLIATLHRKEIDDFVKHMDDVKVTTLEELIEDIENKHKKDNEESKDA